ncbi:TonB-dependent receptor [Proteiniphilum sp. X52]|uniref:TonB-dependent receptor n=1 Tax=Proteiniphilum sp. X52 TaxID=2382159 RepID=UPI000F09B01C|nr:TonB-dependent receptor [Proteiniphilum sp. X52]RNC64007.1 SusC/RagA family TonB-linked outer membrane protein [Proteiniphilum sp. X52]
MNKQIKRIGVSCLVLLLLSIGQTIAQLSVSATNTEIRNVLRQIEKISEYSFFYSDNFLDLSRKVTVQAQDETIENILDTLFRNTNIGYQINNTQIAVSVKGEQQQSLVNTVQQQRGKAISGLIQDEHGEPIIGATIVEKGNQAHGTVSDINGEFTLTSLSENAVLLISYVGMATQEVALNGKSTINITMRSDTELLDELVVIGYGTLRKRDLTGSVVSLSEGRFTEGINTNALQMLNGKAAGVNVSQTSSAPGADTKIQIRGAGSINSSNAALIVVDGLPGVDPSSISPEDIKSIEVLKDASAAAIYGTRAANGVVLITTKGGEKGEVVVKFGSEFGAQSVAKKMDMLDARQYMEILNALRIESKDPRGEIYSPEEIAAAGRGTNWQNEIFRTTAPVQNYQLSFAGGAPKSDYYLGLNYFNQEGLVKKSDFKKFNVRANMNFDPKEFLRFKFTLNYTRADRNSMYENMDGVNEGAGPINSALQFDPTLPAGINPETGRYYLNNFIALDNPMALLNGVKGQNQRNTVYGTFTSEIEPLKDLVATIRLGGTVMSYMQSSYRNRMTMNGLANKGIGSKQADENTQWLVEFLLNYKKNFNGIHRISLLAGTTYEQFMRQYVYADSRGFLSDVTGADLLQSGDNLNGDNIRSFKSRNRLNGILGRINYELLDKYLLTASFRYDGSSRFSPKNQYAFFPSVAGAWRLSGEPFFNINVVDDLKLRIGYGELGNQGIDNYQTIQTLVAGGSAVFGNGLASGVLPARLPNPDLKWETTSELNMGIDFSLLRNRISGTVDYFIRNTKDQLFSKPLPSAIGFNDIMVNAGTVKNSGVDIMINTLNIQNRDFNWETSFNLSFLKNEVTELPSFIPELITGSIAGFISGYELTKIGHPIYSFYGYEVEGIFQKGDDIANSAQPNAKPGDLKFKNQNGDNVIDLNDRVILGKPFPDFTGGLNNRISYKNFTFDLFLQWVNGIETLDANVAESIYPTNEYRNRIAKYYLNRWTEDNPSDTYPSGVNPSSYGGAYSINSLTVTDASFVRLKTVSLSYDIPVKTNKFIRNLQVYASGDNLFTITKFDGFDPDASARGESVSKVNYNSYPLARTIRMGVNVTF